MFTCIYNIIIKINCSKALWCKIEHCFWKFGLFSKCGESLKNIDRESIIKNLGLTNTYHYFHVLFQGGIPSIFLGKITFENKFKKNRYLLDEEYFVIAAVGVFTRSKGIRSSAQCARFYFCLNSWFATQLVFMVISGSFPTPFAPHSR